MLVYIDSEYKCHVTNDSTMTPVETNFFNDKCQAFIEGYRFIPFGETWVREDGVTFTGEMISPWKNYSELDSAQRSYEKEQLTEYKESLETLGVEV